uniref:Uncharacterized protein n=1 Tax=Populus trichocarpa TaxID=3694 RepID=A9PCQ9_POPTR|nr:unknown [Populus trichocarpa]
MSNFFFSAPFPIPILFLYVSFFVFKNSLLSCLFLKKNSTIQIDCDTH